MRERGYMNLNLGGLIVGLMVAGAVAVALLYWAVGAVWPWLKSWLHAVTA